jgi:hypothetical protein
MVRLLASIRRAALAIAAGDRSKVRGSKYWESTSGMPIGVRGPAVLRISI